MRKVCDLPQSRGAALRRERFLVRRVQALVSDLKKQLGKNGKECSNRFLAQCLAPKSKCPPVASVGRWLRGESVPYDEYIAQMAQLKGVSVKELLRYLEGDDKAPDIIAYGVSDVTQCKAAIEKLSGGQSLTPEETADLEDIIKNLPIQALVQLHSYCAENIVPSLTPKQALIYKLQQAIASQLISTRVQ